MMLSPLAFSAHENPPHAYKGFKWQVFTYIQFLVMNNLKWFHAKFSNPLGNTKWRIPYIDVRFDTY
jgi:hypothetical protein